MGWNDRWLATDQTDENLSKIRWRTNLETRYPFGDRSPDPEWFESIGFPPPWPDRPWIYGVVVASANGVLAWRRRGIGDDPVVAVLGDGWRPERTADSRHLRHLRCFGDVFGRPMVCRTIRGRSSIRRWAASSSTVPSSTPRGWA